MNSSFREMQTISNLPSCVGIEDHVVNGRVEKGIRTIRDCIFKSSNMSSREKEPLITEKHNETYHIGIKCTLNEALRGSRLDPVIDNSKMEKISKNFELENKKENVNCKYSKNI